MNYVAIDFETANSSRASACSLAAITVENGKIVRSAYSLIQPPVLKFDYWNTKIHGITVDDVVDKPTFAELWDRIRPHLEEKIVIAHNASFDISVLRSMLNEYGLPHPAFRYACTVDIARRVWTDLDNYKLPTLAKRFSIDFEHHNALHDARTCAMIALLARADTKASSFLHLTDMMEIAVREF
ncbi:3'-5' exonuclease [Sporomusa malonica]|uniref:DNA polymerase-3 subunit epsilon n=1 Tax=Sporomusa malonica TaxID=112901 RepID=A0A1W1ZSJ0_9FIRM|nr:3'-5' exonuclease [Sporomusa malonica]SMC51439.1 DNA polymerase-3 subunit epsilon [Sporomusa malonica]